MARKFEAVEETFCVTLKYDPKYFHHQLMTNQEIKKIYQLYPTWSTEPINGVWAPSKISERKNGEATVHRPAKSPLISSMSLFLFVCGPVCVLFDTVRGEWGGRCSDHACVWWLKNTVCVWDWLWGLGHWTMGQSAWAKSTWCLGLVCVFVFCFVWSALLSGTVLWM